MKKLILIVLILLAGCQFSKTKPEFTWILQNSGTDASLRGLFAVSSKIAWASGSGGTCLRTVDGGRTWVKKKIPGISGFDFRDVHAFDQNTALVLSAGEPAKIFRTENGGASWTETYSNSTPGVFFDAMDFWDGQNGIAFSDPVDGHFLLIKTEDGGLTWREIDPEVLPIPLEGEAGFAASGTCLTVYGEGGVCFGTGGESPRIIRSNDQGKTWEAVPVPILSGASSRGVFSVHFTDKKDGTAVGGDYRVTDLAEKNALFTWDGGKTWLPSAVMPTGFRECITAFPFGRKTGLIAVGPSGSDYSLDLGRSWTKVDTSGYHAVAFPLKSQTGWAAGADGRIAKIVVEHSQKDK